MTLSPLSVRIDAEHRATRRRKRVRVVVDVAAVIAVSWVVVWAFVMGAG